VFGYPGYDGKDTILGVKPTTFFLMHWVNKLNSIICMKLHRHAQQTPGLEDFISEYLVHAKELRQAAESGNQLDRLQILKCAESAQIICTRCSG
jgi:hypothetical protein